eukprot:TRINITY_DN22744_c0_g1_i1.p1 TRINITY_DN22744_c0_g1~~TRINITY_DN22744_c0_g1_i1.p1  ORF type:complete len:226 (-),score=33.34 TRINITY_DN22744_c0_g1_i1:52-729(-)
MMSSSIVLLCIIATCLAHTQNLGDRRLSWDLMRTQSVKAGLNPRQNQTCANGNYVCSVGSFCVDNTFCLQGTIDQYSPMALVSAGAIAQLVQDNINVNCLLDFVGTVDDLIDSFTYWQSNDTSESMVSLKNVLKDVLQGIQDCDKSESWWDQVVGYFKTVIASFFPEVYGAYEILVQGVNIYDDFAGMMNDCSDGAQDYIDCGVNLGNLVNTVYHSLPSQLKHAA